MNVIRAGLVGVATLIISACTTTKPMPTVKQVNLERFMGDWYVIARIPTFIEKNIYNAIERYEQVEPGKIQTTFTYYKGGFDGEKHEMNPVGYVEDDDSKAIWGMQFIWPFKADYRVVYLDDAYSMTVIGRKKRDYVWIMARQPSIDHEEYQALVDFVASLGYDTSELRKVPQQW